MLHDYFVKDRTSRLALFVTVAITVCSLARALSLFYIDALFDRGVETYTHTTHTDNIDRAPQKPQVEGAGMGK